MLITDITSAHQDASLALLAMSFASLAIIISSSLLASCLCVSFFSSHTSANLALGYVGSLRFPYIPNAKSAFTFYSPSFSNFSSNFFNFSSSSISIPFNKYNDFGSFPKVTTFFFSKIKTVTIFLP